MNPNVYKEPEKLLQKLIAFDTSNPPGYEKDCCLFIKELLESAGIETKTYALDENRPNLWAEIRAESSLKRPVLMYGHMDVVPAEHKDWKHHPFSGDIENGYIYGRGAADMKSGLTMFICVMLAVKLEKIKLDFDLLFLALSDEEDTGKYGAVYMVEKYPELFDNIACALGEMGGYSRIIGGKRFYPLVVAEKQCAAVKLTFHGKSGHGSARHHNTAMEKMARAIAALSSNRLRTRITSEASFMVKEAAKGIGGYKCFMLKMLINPLFTNWLLEHMGDEFELFDNLLHNSVNVTIAHGGNAVNVVPGRVSMEADVRVLPGYGMEEALFDIKEVLAKKANLSEKDYEIEVTFFDENSFTPDLTHFNSLRSALLEADPEGIPIPFVLGAVTDGRILSRAGVMTYGFTPMRLPESFDYLAQAHGAEECLPISVLPFGIGTILSLLTKYY